MARATGRRSSLGASSSGRRAGPGPSSPRRWPAARGGPGGPASIGDGRLTGLALSGRKLVWGQSTDAERTGVVAVADVDAARRQRWRSDVTGLAGPPLRRQDRRLGRERRRTRRGRVMARRAAADGAASSSPRRTTRYVEVAVSGERVAWIEHAAGGRLPSIVDARLPR